MVELTDEEHAQAFRMLVQKARTDLLTFALLMRPPGVSEYIYGELHKSLMALVQGVVEGTEGKRQITTVPPQHGKSQTLSVVSVAWLMGRKPGLHIAMTGFSFDLLIGFSKQVKALVDTPLWRMIFPDVSISSGYDRGEAWALTNGSSVTVKSTGRKLTGKRVDWLIIDDPYAGRREAESGVYRSRVREWYFGDCVTRLSPNAVVFVVTTRWHPDDLIGTLTGEDYVKDMTAAGNTSALFKLTNYEALCEDEENDPLGRERGEALFPEVRTREFLESLKNGGTLSYEWDSQYQGTPRTTGSGQVNISKLTKIHFEEMPTDVEFIRGWDCAVTTRQSSDFTAGPLCAYCKRLDHFYIVDMYRDKKAWPQLKPDIVRLAMIDRQEKGLVRIGFEAVAGFRTAYDDLRESLLGEIRVELRNPVADKLLRAQPWFTKVEAGKVFIVRGNWNREFLAELDVFPDGTHDDQVDGVSICFEMVHKRQKLLYA